MLRSICTCRRHLRDGGGGPVSGAAGRWAGHSLRPGQVGRPRDAHAVLPGRLWVLHLLHLLSATPEAEAERVGWQLCPGVLIYIFALVGWTGGLPLASEKPLILLSQALPNLFCTSAALSLSKAARALILSHILMSSLEAGVCFEGAQGMLDPSRAARISATCGPRLAF